MEEVRESNFKKISLDILKETVIAEPKVPCSEQEILDILHDLAAAVDAGDYVVQTPTGENPSLSDDYIFDIEDENRILRDLTPVDHVAKIRDLSKGAVKRRDKGLPQEYLHVFQYPCSLQRRDAQESRILNENILIYIKINVRRVPYEKVFVISFHKNRK